MDKKIINDIADKLEDIKKGKEELNEFLSVAIPESDIKPSDMKRIKTLETLFKADFSEFHDDNGSVIHLNLKNKLGGSLVIATDWQAISKSIKRLKIRWIKFSDGKVSVGLDSINEY